MKAELRAYQFLGLTPQEVRILTALPPQDALSVTELSRVAHLPRATAHDVVHKLHARGLIRKVPRGRSVLWKRPTASTIKRRLTATEHVLRPFVEHIPHEIEKASVYNSDTLHVDVIRGARNIVHIYANAYAGNPGERTYLTQLPRGFRSFWKKTPVDLIKQINSIAQTHAGILEVLMTDKTKKEYAQLAFSDASWAPNASERMVDVSVVSNDFFDKQNAELFIARNTVTLTDWEAETAIMITSAQLADMLKSFFAIAKSQGPTFDNQYFLRSLPEHLAKFQERASDTQPRMQ